MIIRIISVIFGILAVIFTYYFLAGFFGFVNNIVGFMIGLVPLTLAIICWWIAIKIYDPESRRYIKFSIIGAFATGFIGFIGGIAVPILFSVGLGIGGDPNPFLGMFVTGPLGFALGGIAGYSYSRFNVRKKESEKTAPVS